MPRLTFFMLLFTFSSIGLPGLNGFAGEFPILLGMFQRGWSQAPGGLHGQLLVIAVLAVSGVVLGAWYMLWLVQRVFFGPLREPPGFGAAGEAAGGTSDPSHASHATHASHAMHASPGAIGAHGGHAAEAAGGHVVSDMNLREVLALAPLALFVFWIGLSPGTFLQPIAPAVGAIAAPIEPLFQADYATKPTAPQPAAPTRVLMPRPRVTEPARWRRRRGASLPPPNPPRRDPRRAPPGPCRPFRSERTDDDR